MSKSDDGRDKLLKQLDRMVHDNVVLLQAVYIEWKHGNGAEAAMEWIENSLDGPGHIPREDEPWGTEAQAYYDANKAEPFPTCDCGRPSNQLWMGRGFCSMACYNKARLQ